LLWFPEMQDGTFQVPSFLSLEFKMRRANGQAAMDLTLA